MDVRIQTLKTVMMFRNISSPQKVMSFPDSDSTLMPATRFMTVSYMPFIQKNRSISLIEKKEDKAKATSSNETVNTQTVQETPAVTKPEEKPQNEANDPNVYFKQEFWALIHQRVASMDDYHNLYVNYKDKVSGEEFEYLRTVILENYAGFKKWYDKLKTIPDKQLNSIYSITELSRYIN